MGRLGATQLAAATLALNLTFTLNVLLLGLLIASSPMMATALGKGSTPYATSAGPSGQAFGSCSSALRPTGCCCGMSVADALLGQAPELASQGQTFLRAYMWCTAPWLLFQLLRNFVSALERPRVVLWLSLGGIALNALLSWALIFGHFGLPALGLLGGGVGSTLTWLSCAGV